MAEDSPTTPSLFGTWSIVHFTIGILCGIYVNLSIWLLIIFHVVFELWENSPMGINFVQSTKSIFMNQFFINIGLSWGLFNGDSALNSNMDTLCFTLGVLIGKWKIGQFSL